MSAPATVTVTMRIGGEDVLTIGRTLQSPLMDDDIEITVQEILRDMLKVARRRRDVITA